MERTEHVVFFCQREAAVRGEVRSRTLVLNQQAPQISPVHHGEMGE